MGQVVLPQTIDPPTVTTAEVQGNFEALRDAHNVNDTTLSTLAGTGANGGAKGSFSAKTPATPIVTSGGVVNFTAEDWDVSGSHAAGVYTPPVAGIYRLTICVISSGVGIEHELQKNGVQHRSLGYMSALTTRRIHSLLVQSNGTDTFRVYVPDNGTGGSYPVDAQSFFQGELVGRT